jgi:hypothetical protein
LLLVVSAQCLCLLKQEFILLRTGHAQQTLDQLLNLFLSVAEVQAGLATLGHTMDLVAEEQDSLLKDG